MISIVCVYNNEKKLSDVLLKSLANQTAAYELITLDNTGNRYRSAAEALNSGGTKAKGDYLMFVHQDLWLGSSSWLEDVEEMLKSIPDLGVAGVAGTVDKGRNSRERFRFSIDTYLEECWEETSRVQEPEEVQTLDECLLIVPETVFAKLQFDEKVFDGWDCYGVDYCLSIKQLGLKAYVIPAPCSHSCLRAYSKIWELKGLLKSQKSLYKKHKSNYKYIYTWLGDISWLTIVARECFQFFGPIYSVVFPDLSIILKKELFGCDTVLDLGCGNHSPLLICKIPFSVGVELSEPSLQESRRKGIHGQHILADIRQLEFKPKSFDAVVAVEVLEHLTKQEGAQLLNKMEYWARKKVVLITPNGYVRQGTYEKNRLQEHKSGWSVAELRKLKFKVFGLQGWIRLRENKFSVKYKPTFFWGRVSGLTEKLTYHYPKLAFQLLAIKQMNHGERK